MSPGASGGPTLSSALLGARGGGGGTSAGKKGRRRKKTSELDFDGGEGSGDDDGRGARDAHLIMGATSAVNSLLALVDGPSTSDGERRDAAVVMSAVSHHLAAALVADRTALDSVTKAGRGPGGGAGGDEGVPGERSSGRTSPVRGAAAAAEEEEGRRAVCLSHAKTVVGRALTSSTLGALWSLTALADSAGDAGGGRGAGRSVEEKPAAATDGPTAEQSLTRKAMWSALMTLEMCFQLNPRPRVLSTSSMSNPVSSGIRAVSLGRTTGTPSRLAEYDHLLSSTYAGASSTSGAAAGSAGTIGAGGRAHAMMGAGTVAMWNAMLGRITLDYAVVFHGECAEGETWRAEENDYLAGACRRLSEGALGGHEGDVLRAALGMEGEGTAGPPPAKRAKKAGGKSKKGKAAAAAEGGYSGLSALLAARDENAISFDCHVAVRRWAVLAFGWL